MGHSRFLFTARVQPFTVAAPVRAVKGTGAAADGPRVAWRLVGGNNHELGRSHAAFADLDSCLRAVDDLRNRLGDLAPEMLGPGDHPPATGPHDLGEWGWRLLLDGEPVAMSGRWYRRAREAEHNLDQFRVEAPMADISHVVGEAPPRRELLRPSFLLPHLRPSDPLPDDVVAELPDQDVDGSDEPPPEHAVAGGGKAEAS